MTPAEVHAAVAELEDAYDVQLDQDVWVNSFANADAARLAAAIAWWRAHHDDRPPSPADIKWVGRTQLNPNVKTHIAEARAVIDAARHPKEVAEK